jgi:DNA polymerase-3 subunit epsilon
MSYTDKLIDKLLKKPITINQFNKILEEGDTFFQNIELEKELILENGLPLYFKDDEVYLKTTKTKIKDQIFCVVDIETNAGNPKDGQLLEIAAIKYKNGQILETYQSLVSANYIPRKVQEITGITLDILNNAPNQKDVLEEFKIFLEDDIFVAHNIKFDYKFLNDSFKKYHLGELLNRKVCTIELAQRTIKSKRYGLKYLKELLNIDVKVEHRAYDDTFSTVKVLDMILNNIPKDIATGEDLIYFSKTAPIINEIKEEK